MVGKTRKAITISSVFLSTPMEEREAIRIAEHLGTESVYDDIVNVYCPKASSLFLQYEKRVTVRGFRPGTDAHRTKACEQLLEFLKQPHHKYFRPNWYLYRNGVLEYVQYKYPAFFSILKTKIRKAELSTAVDVILKEAVLGRADFAHIDEFAELFALDALRRTASSAKEETDNNPILTKIIRDLSDKVPDHEVKAPDSSTIASDGKKVSDLELKVASLLSSMEKIEFMQLRSSSAPIDESQFAKQITHDLSELQKGMEKVKLAARNAETNVGELSGRLQEYESICENNKKCISSQQKEFDLLKQSVHSVENMVNRLQEAINAQIQRQQPSSETIRFYKNISTPKKAQVVTNEVAFASHYALALDRLHGIQVDTAQAYVYHKIFLESPMIALEDHTLFSTWVSTLGWKANCLNLVASPIWGGAEDWKDGVVQLMDRGGPPKFVVIHDFDIALVKCYLLPVLRKLSLNDHWYSSTTKLLLIASEPNALVDYPDVLQYGSSILAEDERKLLARKRRFETFLEQAKLGFEYVGNTFVTSDVMDKWRSDLYSSDSLEEIWRASGLKLPVTQSRLAELLVGSMGRALTRSEALLASTYHTIRTYTEARDGADIADELYELAMVEAGDKVTY